VSDEPIDPEGGSHGESSDLFSVKAYTSGTSIPVIDKVPETKEEIRRKRIIRIVAAVTAVVVIALIAWGVLWWRHRSAIHEAMTQVSDDGRLASATEAIELLDGDDDPEARAMTMRVRAMLVLAGEEDAADEIAASLAGLSTDDADVARERGVAETYLALARGDLAAAMETASSIDATGGDFRAESLRARALAAWSVGNVEVASAAAEHAVSERPDAPRHVALHAELIARTGDTDAAIARLDEVPEAARNGATRIARARILDRGGAHQAEVVELSEAVLADEAATDHEMAWARLLLARAAAAGGDRVTAREHLDQASEVAPPGDELFTMTLTEAALRMGATVFAREVSERLPSPLSIDAGRRAQLSAELALSRRDLNGADAALRHAPPGAKTSLLRARLLQARGRAEEAERLYLEAAEDPAHRVPAMVHLASMELAADDAAQAVSRVEPLLGEYPDHPDIVPVAVEAQLGLEQAARAMELVEPALEAHPQDVRLLAAKAHVQAALERWEDALGTLDAALRIESDDANLHADRGVAAQELSRREVAREAFDAALALDATHPVALVGRLRLDVEDLQATEARRILERIDEASIESLEVERLRARLLAIEVAGHSGTRTLRRALASYDDDPVLIRYLGWLYMQAEEYAHAVRRFSQLLVGDDDPPDAVLAKALAQLRMRASNPARSLVEGFTDDYPLESLEPWIRAQYHALQARLAWSDHNRPLAQREADAALELDRHNSEAHLVRAEILSDRDQDATEELEASLHGPHPSSRAFALLSIREEVVTDPICEYARRYRRAAPNGQYARGTWRVRRDCRHRDYEDEEDE